MICRVGILLGSLMLLGCASITAPEFIQALNAAHVAHCVQINAAFPPYGNAAIYATAGELDCLTLWKARMQLGQ